MTIKYDLNLNLLEFVILSGALRSEKSRVRFDNLKLNSGYFATLSMTGCVSLRVKRNNANSLDLSLREFA